MRARGTVVLGLLTAAVLIASAQTPTVDVSGGLVQVRPSGLTLLDAGALARLKDGALVQLNLSVALYASQTGVPIARRTDTFRVSYDLWEERFAATRVGPPPRSTVQPTRERLDGWCLGQLAIPVTELAALGRGAPFWLRLQYGVDGPERRAAADPEDSFMLSGLIDLFSRRRSHDGATRTLEAGPVYLTP